MPDEAPDLLAQLQADSDGTFSYALASEFLSKARASQAQPGQALSAERAAAFRVAADIVERVTQQMRRTSVPFK